MFSWLFSYHQQLSVLIVGFGYDVSVMISSLFQLSLKIIFIVKLVRLDCEFQI